MHPIATRRATLLDTGPMARLLNEIISAGGTTAITDAVSGATLAEWMQAEQSSAWQVAEDATGILGFQFIGPHPKLPPDACDIATFVRRGRTGLGIGSALFEATQRAVDALGYHWINANIRADNEGGLIYYKSRGFREYGVQRGVTLGNGQTVDKILMRYDLR